MSTAVPEYEDENTGLQEVVVAKLTAMAVLLVASMVCGLTPLLLSRHFAFMQVGDIKNTNRVVVSLLAFGGGVLFSTTFMHLVPEVDHNIEYLQAVGLMPTFDFSLAPLLMCIGFFIMFFVEECVHLYLHRREKNNRKQQPLVRSLSIRGSRGPTDKNVSLSTSDLIDPETPSQEKMDTHEHNGHSHGKGHGHSHMPVMADGEDSVTSALRGLLIVLALSIHELFEGLAVGLESSASNVWYMLGAVAAHKLVIAFCIGVELLAAKTRTSLAILYITTFAVVSPLGIGIGLLLVGGEGATGAGVYSVVLQGLASGTLTYVIFFEIWKGDRSGMVQYLAALFGFCFMFGLQLLTPHTHSHGGEGGGHTHSWLVEGDEHDDHDHQ